MTIVDKLVGKAQSTLNDLTGAIKSTGPVSAADFIRSPLSSQLPNKDNPDYQAVITCTDLGISLTAYLPETWQFNIASDYSAPYAEGLTEGIPSFMGVGLKAAGVSLTTQVLTGQMWKGSSEVSFSLPLVFQAENDPDKEVMLPLMQLMYLTLPRDSINGGGGLLSAPGPYFDLVDTSPEASKAVIGQPSSRDSKSVAGNKSFLDKMKDTSSNLGGALGTAGEAAMEFGSAGVGMFVGGLTAGGDGGADLKRSTTNAFHTANKYLQPVSNLLAGLVKNKISLKIGNMLLLDSVVITSVDQNHRVQPTVGMDGKPTGLYQYCEVTVQFKTFFTPTQRDLLKMFLSATNSKAFLDSLINKGG